MSFYQCPGGVAYMYVTSNSVSYILMACSISDAAIRKEWDTDASKVRELLCRDIKKTQSDTIAKYHEVRNCLS